RQFWADYLADPPEPATLGSARPSSSGFIRCTGALPFSRIEYLQSIAHHIGVTLPQLITAAATLFVHRMAGAHDVMLDIPLTARMSPAARCTPGMMANVLPLRLTVHPSMTVAQLASETARQMRRVIRHQRYDVANLRRDIGRTADTRAFGPTLNF